MIGTQWVNTQSEIGVPSPALYLPLTAHSENEDYKHEHIENIKE